MLVLFVILIAFATAFSVIFLMTYAQDRKTFRTQLGTMVRPLIFLVLATIFWVMTMPAFTAADTTITQLPSYTIAANSVNGNTLFTIASANVITNNVPFVPGTFYIYLALWIPIIIIHFILLIAMLLTWMADSASDAIKGTD